MSKYQIDYDLNGAAQINVPRQTVPHNFKGDVRGDYTDAQGVPHYARPYREPFRMPAIVNTAFTLIIAGVVFFGMERFAPHDLKPSTNVGGFEASVGAQMKAAELNEQARFAAFEAETKLAVETQAKQNELMQQSILAHYQAVYDRAKTMTEAANNYQGKYLDARISQVTSVQSADTGIVTISKLIGRGLNLIEPGSGDAALDYADNITEGLEAGLTEAARDGVRVDLTDWYYGLPSPAEVKAQLQSVAPVKLPTPPRLSFHQGSVAPNAASDAGNNRTLEKGDQ